MIKYNYTYYHRELLKLQSFNFNRYELVTEEDLLINDLCNEQIGDYSEIDWLWIAHLLHGEEQYYGKEGWCYFDVDEKLEIFASKIASQAERIRILTFLRDNCRDCLFQYKYTEDECIEKFEKECARLICKSLHPLRPDEVHGKFLQEPQPNLEAIAMGEPKKEYSIMEHAIMAAIPTFPNDRNLIRKEILLQVAYDFMDLFQKLVEAYEESGRDERKKPCMSQKHYVDIIYKMIGTRANRYLYWDINPVYQVYFISGCLWSVPNHRYTWWEETFAKGIGDYLETTKNFKGSKAKIKEVVQRILGLNQYFLDFAADEVEQAKEEMKVDKQVVQEPSIEASKPEVPKEANPDDSIFAESKDRTKEQNKKELLRIINDNRCKSDACREIRSYTIIGYFNLKDKTDQAKADAINPWVAQTNKAWIFTGDDFKKARYNPKKKKS